MNRNGDRTTIAFDELLEHPESIACDQSCDSDVVRIDIIGGLEVERYDAHRVHSLGESLRQEGLVADRESTCGHNLAHRTSGVG